MFATLKLLHSISFALTSENDFPLPPTLKLCKLILYIIIYFFTP